MTNFQEIINNSLYNGYLTYSSFVLTVISLITAYIFYKKSKIERCLSYKITTIDLIKSGISKLSSLKIIFKEKEINSLSLAQIKIINTGNVALRDEDIAPSKKITIHLLNKAEILDISCPLQKNKTTTINITKVDDNTVNIIFDFMNPSDYIYLKIIHTGVSKSDISITASIIGETKAFSELDKEYSSPSPNWLAKIILNIIHHNPRYYKIPGFLSIFLGVIMFYMIYVVYVAYDKIPFNLLSLFFLTIFLVFAIMQIYSGLKRIINPTPLDTEEFRLKVDNLSESLHTKDADEVKNLLLPKNIDKI